MVVPAETHQLGRDFDAAVVAEFLRALLDGESHGGRDDDVTLAELGVSDDDADWLWEAVCDEFAERTVGPEPEPGLISPAMTIGEAAARITTLLEEGDGDGS